MVNDNKNTLNKETISFYSYDDQLDTQKTESNEKKQEKSNSKIKKLKVQKNYFTNKKKLIGICFFVLSFLILIFAFLKVPYTGAILDNVLEFFFGWVKYYVYAILLLFLIVFYIKKVRRRLFNKWMILFYIITLILFTLIIGAVGYGIITNSLTYKFIINTNQQMIDKQILNSYKDNFEYISLVNLHSKKLHLCEWWAYSWSQEFLKAIGEKHYYYTSVFAYGGIVGYANLDLYRANVWIFTIVIMFMILVLIYFILITFGTNSRLALKFKKWLVNKIITNINNYHKKDYQLGEQNFFEEKLGADHHNINKQLEQKEVIQEQNLQIKNFNDQQINSSHITKNDKLKTTILEPIANDIDQFQENPSIIKNNKYNFYPRIDIIDGKSQDYLHELKSIGENLKLIIDKFLENNQLEYHFNAINPYFSNVEIVYQFTRLSLNNFLKNYLNLMKQAVSDTDDYEINIYNDNEFLIIQAKVKDLNPQINIKDILTNLEYNDKLCLGIGKLKERKVVWLEDTQVGSILIHGSQQFSGKSMLISNIIISALYTKSPNELELFIINNGSKSLKEFAKLKHTKKSVDHDDFENVINLLKEIMNDINKQNTLFVDNNVDNLDEYNLKNQNQKLPKKLIIISEYDDIVSSQFNTRFDTLIRNIANIAKKHGIVLIISSNITNEKTVSFKNVFDYTIVLKLNNPYESILLTDRNWCNNLVGFGDILLIRNFDNLPLRLQTAKITNEQFANIINEINSADYDVDEYRHETRLTSKTQNFFNK
ncbi:FtsK/SpoIIIE domain-containing protein [Ureaplasma parvum]|uniref:FtsK/SpoIIIE domain-containing protein n=1 Tax=Ureaplasma parvum TaxID=134821 RepID=UPI0026F1E836|nr:DNA translocase FtsK [Ureaplasma parvum]